MPMRATQVHASEQVDRLRIALAVLARGLRQTTAGAGLTPTELSVLATTARTGPLRLAALAEAEGINPTMLSRIVARLVELGLVERAPDSADRRAALVEATRDGRLLQLRIRAERSESLAAHLAELSDDERSALDAALPALESLGHHLRRPERA